MTIKNEEVILAKQEWLRTVDLLKEVNTNSFYVVLSGIQNSGKSTLGNVLIGDLFNKTFKVGDYRLTDKNEEKIADDGITYVDTPGYGTTKEGDNISCKDAWLKGNVILFLHSIRLGGADLKDEMDMLKDLSDFIPDIKKRLLIVFTNKSEKNEEDCQLAINSFIDKANELLGIECNYVCIDSEWYQQAMRNEKISQKLIEQSGINEIREWIKKSRNIKSPALTLFNNAQKKYLNVLNNELKNKEKNIQKIKKLESSFKIRIEKKVESGITKLTTLWNKCNELKISIKELKEEIKDLED